MAQANIKSCQTIDAVAITEFIEIIVFVNTSTPDPDHIHIGICGIRHHFFVIRTTDSGEKNIVGNGIDSFGKNRDSVQFKVESFSLGILPAY